MTFKYDIYPAQPAGDPGYCEYRKLTGADGEPHALHSGVVNQ